MDYINTPVSQNIPMDENLSDILMLKNKLVSSAVPSDLKNEVLVSIDRLEKVAKKGVYSSEYENVSKYLDCVTRIPWGILSKDNMDIHNAKQVMDASHYGMDGIKNSILDYLAAMQLETRQNLNQYVAMPSSNLSNLADRPEIQRVASPAKSPVFLFVGLQGVGKTSVAQSIAKAMDRKFVRISLGAIGDVRTLRGTPRYAVDPEPGQIVKALMRSGTMNPVILLDEIEKASGNAGLMNDVMAALLEILDPEQNTSFVDHYVDYPVDLSHVFFICTANNLGGLSAALLDRVEVIRFTSYTDEEKTVIAKRYILPKVLRSLNLSEEYIRIDDMVWPMIIRPVGFDAGIRQLERNIASIVRAVARTIVEGAQLPIIINAENLKRYLPVDQGPLS